MVKRDTARGPFGAWLVRQRKARPGSGRDGRMTAAEARQSVMREVGLGISAWAELEAGSRLPSREQREALERWAGEPSPTSGGSEMEALLELVRSQTEELKMAWQAISELAASIRSTRLDPGELAAVVVQVLEARAQQAREASQAPLGSAVPRQGRTHQDPASTDPPVDTPRKGRVP